MPPTLTDVAGPGPGRLLPALLAAHGGAAGRGIGGGLPAPGGYRGARRAARPDRDRRAGASRRPVGWRRPTGVMLQAVWFDAGEEDAGRLLLTIHHLAVDGVSWRILLPDLKAA